MSAPAGSLGLGFQPRRTTRCRKHRETRALVAREVHDRGSLRVSLFSHFADFLSGPDELVGDRSGGRGKGDRRGTAEPSSTWTRTRVGTSGHRACRNGLRNSPVPTVADGGGAGVFEASPLIEAPRAVDDVEQ
jgi:hypothetical protein